jgi:copper chaperone CopZ
MKFGNIYRNVIEGKKLMMRTIALASILTVIAGCDLQPAATSSDVNKSARPIAFNSAGAPTVEFSLPNMVCDDEECALAVEDILARQPGAKDVLVDVGARKATVAIEGGKFDSQIALADLVERGFHLELQAAAEFNPTGAPTVEFSVPDMMCEEGCAVAVKEILAERPGVTDVRVDFAGRTAIVAIVDGKFDSQLAIAELVDKGFDNSQLKSDSTGDKSPAGMPGKNARIPGPIKPQPRTVSHPPGDKTAQ